MEGTDDIYDLTPAPGTVTEEGTFLNVENLLKDTTAALLGGNANMVPDEALVALKLLVDGANNNANAKAKITTGNYVGTGNAETFSRTFPCGFKPKFFALANTAELMASGNTGNSSGLIVWIEGVATVIAGDSSANYSRNFNCTQQSTGLKISYVKSTNAHFDVSSKTYTWVAIG